VLLSSVIIVKKRIVLGCIKKKVLGKTKMAQCTTTIMVNKNEKRAVFSFSSKNRVLQNGGVLSKSDEKVP